MIITNTAAAMGVTTATVTFDTDEPGDTKVTWSFWNGASWIPVASLSNGSLVTSHSMPITGLTADTLYKFDCESMNGGGDVATSSVQARTLKALYKNPTGKRAMLYSFKKWLQANVPDNGLWAYAFLNELDPAVMPRVELCEFNYPSPGDTAMGGVIFPNPDDPTVQREGRRNMAMLEINILTDQAKDPSAYQTLLKIRDAVIHGITNSGTTSDLDDTEIYPPVLVVDPENGDASTETIARVKTEDDNAVVETYYKPSADQPQIHRQQILARVEWWEMRN